MLTKDLAGEIIKKISDISERPIAVVDLVGNVLDRTDNFTYKHNPIEVKTSKKALPIVVEGEKAGYIYIDGKEADIEEEGPIIKSMVELFLHQKLILENITTEDKKINKFIYDILHRVDLDEKQILSQGQIYGFDLKNPKIAIIVDLEGDIKNILYNDMVSPNEKEAYWGRVKRAISFSFESFYTRHKGNITAYIGGSKFVVLKDLGTREEVKENLDHFLRTLNSLQYIIAKELRSTVTMGIGRYYKGVGGLRESFDEAVLAVDFGSQVWGKNKVYHFDKFGVVAPLIQGDDNEVKFSKDLFTNFSNKEELIKTLNVFFEHNMSLTTTADVLKIHRNTLVYRLDKITEILSLDPRVFDDAVQIKLSMLFSEILK